MSTLDTTKCGANARKTLAVPIFNISTADTTISLVNTNGLTNAVGRSTRKVTRTVVHAIGGNISNGSVLRSVDSCDMSRGSTGVHVRCDVCLKRRGWILKLLRLTRLYAYGDPRQKQMVRSVLLRVGGVAGRFPDIGTLSGISLRMEHNDMRTLVKRGKTNGSALVGYLFNVCSTSSKAIFLRNRRMGFGGPTRTLSHNITVIRRRLGRTLAQDIVRGV